MLERYLVIRQLYPHWFRGLDIDDPAISELLVEGYIVPLPQRDYFGRQVILTCAGKFSQNKCLSCLCTKTLCDILYHSDSHILNSTNWNEKET
jgi:hypothetical protein